MDKLKKKKTKEAVHQIDTTDEDIIKRLKKPKISKNSFHICHMNKINNKILVLNKNTRKCGGDLQRSDGHRTFLFNYPT